MSDSRRAQWLRGALDLCVLAALSDKERYGYDLAQHLEKAGLGKVKGGTLYPLLARLEKGGHVSTSWREGRGGPSRKYYSLTGEGRSFLLARSEEWLAFAQTVEALMRPARRED